MNRRLCIAAWIIGLFQFQAQVFGAGPAVRGSDSRSEANAVAAGVQQRVARSQAAFDEFVRNFPDQETTVLASFVRPMDIEEAVASARVHGLDITGFRHGSSPHSGGYTLAPGEVLDNAIAQYRHDASFFTNEDIRNTDEMIANVADKEVQQALRERRANLLVRKQELDRVGLKILGVEVRGKGAELSNFQKANTFVRVLEIQDGARKNAAISPSE